MEGNYFLNYINFNLFTFFFNLFFLIRFGTSGIVYQLIGKGSEFFVVDKKTGSITVAPCPSPGNSPCLDFEEQSEYFLNFKVHKSKYLIIFSNLYFVNIPNNDKNL